MLYSNDGINVQASNVCTITPPLTIMPSINILNPQKYLELFPKSGFEVSRFVRLANGLQLDYLNDQTGNSNLWTEKSTLYDPRLYFLSCNMFMPKAFKVMRSDAASENSPPLLTEETPVAFLIIQSFEPLQAAKQCNAQYFFDNYTDFVSEVSPIYGSDSYLYYIGREPAIKDVFKYGNWFTVMACDGAKQIIYKGIKETSPIQQGNFFFSQSYFVNLQ